MKRITYGNNELLVLAKREHLMQCLEQYAIETNLKGAWINGIGAASAATIGAYDPAKKGYLWKSYQEPLELLSLQGNLSWVDGKPFWHIHGSFSTKDLHSIGGHIKEVEIGVTAELFITPLASALTRSFDDDTGIKLLQEPN